MKKAITTKGFGMKVKRGNDYRTYYTKDSTKQEFLDKNCGFELPVSTTLDDIEELGELDIYQIKYLTNQIDLTNLFDFRESLSDTSGYTKASKSDISKLLKKGYFVAVKGLGEIENISELN